MTDKAVHPPEDPDVAAVVREVRCAIDLDNAELGDEFFPAHVSIALLDAIFTPQLRYNKAVVPIIERYCRRFQLRRVRQDRTKLPPVDEQETLTDLLDHYKKLGPDGMQKEVIRSRFCSPGTKVLKSKNVKLAADKLRRLGIETLQDAECFVSKAPKKIKGSLRSLSGIGDRTIHMLLMYLGGEEFVKGDVHVCRFVARALGGDEVLPEEAERLVKQAAKVLDITPRLLDNMIWNHMKDLKKKRESR